MASTAGNVFKDFSKEEIQLSLLSIMNVTTSSFMPIFSHSDSYLGVFTKALLSWDNIDSIYYLLY